MKIYLCLVVFIFVIPIQIWGNPSSYSGESLDQDVWYIFCTSTSLAPEKRQHIVTRIFSKPNILGDGFPSMTLQYDWEQACLKIYGSTAVSFTSRQYHRERSLDAAVKLRKREIERLKKIEGTTGIFEVSLY